eukprot:1733333-Rhodomonas_salina.1
MDPNGSGFQFCTAGSDEAVGWHDVFVYRSIHAILVRGFLPLTFSTKCLVQPDLKFVPQKVPTPVAEYPGSILWSSRSKGNSRT